ncbi:hypothetical protein BWQ96_03677 [Gracilariopsis chorda]|uniref:Uncharacterized protein n=1 Tax=Gracilariopsis chorda TaxID=448386 RepID=A0A2V3IWS2_9FLOR|nr:hypothetical protein BWQ96_03677 [Gracilariopsis chorda]|eukprot:PXF46549.1 hypothetical protein BWQ96_03677 [Gracilariopsis chorda]
MEELVELTPNNFVQLKQDVCDIVRKHEYNHLLEGSLTLVTNEDHEATVSHRRIITKSIMQEVTDLLVDINILTRKPQLIVQTIRQTIESHSATNYFSLTTEDLNLIRTESIAEFILAHLAIHRKQIVANTPVVYNERVKINYILQGLVNDRRVSQRALSVMLDSPPIKIKDKQHRLEQYESIFNQQTPMPGLVPFMGHTNGGSAQNLSGTRGRGLGCGGYSSFGGRGIQHTIEELNKEMDALQTTESRCGRGCSTAKQACSTNDATSAEIVQAM